MKESINTLVIYAQYTDKLSYYDDWLDAFQSSPDFAVTTANIREPAELSKVSSRISDFDLIVLLHSTNGDTVEYLLPYQSTLNRRRGKLLSFVGNEVNLPGVSMRAKINFLRDVGADFIATQIPLEAGRWLFEDCNSATVVALPHALNPKAFQPTVPFQNRKIDVGMRTHYYLPFLGDNDRNRLLDFFSTYDSSLVVDIDTKSRFNREGWSLFLNDCKATVSNEAGTFFLERDDETVNAICDFLVSQRKVNGERVIHQDSLANKVWLRLPETARGPLRAILKKLTRARRVEDCYLDMEFEAIYQKFFKDYSRPKFYSKCISSRHFDAIGTKTCQILLKGKYNDILVPDIHYLSLEPDFSNIDEVLRKFQDDQIVKALVDNTYQYIMDQHTYQHRVAQVCDLVVSNQT